MTTSFLESLRNPDAYPHEVDDEIILHETHISWVVLAGEWAYKIKKPVKNNFVDYSTLALRKHFCEEELRLNQRFAKEIYLEVVAITRIDNQAGKHFQIEGAGEPIEYAVRMKRFAGDALLSHRVAHNLIHTNDVRALAAGIAAFHSQAAIAEASSRFGTPELIYSEALANFHDIAAQQIPHTSEWIELLERWTIQSFSEHEQQFRLRKQANHIRECHGDLHLGNVVLWKDELLPFDGVEFCDEFRWIDTISDAAFTAMDFAAFGRMDLSHSFANAYFESTGDYSALGLLQWYVIYRAMVRAKVAALRLRQTSPATQEHAAAENDLDAMLDLASRFTQLHRSKPQLWITYGLSGSGKTTGTEQLVQRHGAIRIRADVERKRLAGLSPLDRVIANSDVVAQLYSKEMTTATYQRLADIAEQLLLSDMDVIVDATCLLKRQRAIFKELALRLSVPFRILAFHADTHALRERITQRQLDGYDASDADLEVLNRQIKMQEHLDADEMPYIGSLTE